MAPAAHVAEDGLVGHQWEEKFLAQCPSVGECHGVEVGGIGEGGKGHPHRSRGRVSDRMGSMEENPGKGICK